MGDPAWTVRDGGRPRDIGLGTPNVARMHGYLLGGKDHFAPDREAADRALSVAPGFAALARANRAFLGRAVRYLTARGIRQFVDLGTGLPVRGGVHEVAPEARVVYVDNDPVVLTHLRALVESDSRDTVTVVDADMRQPDLVLDHPRVRERADFAEPVAVLALLVAHFLTDADQPAKVVGGYRDAIAPGSYLVLSHATDERRARSVRAAARVYDHAAHTMTPRSRVEIAGLFDGFALAEPGLVYLPEWRPDRGDPRCDACGVLAGVGRSDGGGHVGATA